jgi:outer membrane protein OmpA-like peptidoglycan-associated protein
MKFSQLILSSLLVAAWGTSHANELGNWRSADGAAWRTSDPKQCWRSSSWTANNASKDCDGAFVPPPPPAPVVQKAPSVVIGVNQSPRGVELVLPNQVLFEVGKASLNLSGSAPYLDRMVELILTKSKNPVLVEGHTDSVGSPSANQALSEQRAAVIFEALKSRGVPTDRLKAVGVAATRPVAPNTLEAGRKLNRRTEIIVLEETVANLMRGEPTNSFEQVADIIKRELEKGTR